MTSLRFALCVLLAGVSARAAVVERLPTTTRTSSPAGNSLPAPLEMKAFTPLGAPGLQAPALAPSAPSAEIHSVRAAAEAGRPAMPAAAPVAAAPAMPAAPAAPVAPGAAAPLARGGQGLRTPAPTRAEASSEVPQLKTLRGAAASDSPVFWDGARPTLREADLGEASGVAAGASGRRALPRADRPQNGPAEPSRTIDALEPPAAEAGATARFRRFLREVLLDDAAVAKDGRRLEPAAKEAAADARAGHLLSWIEAVNPAGRKPAAGVKHQLQYDLPEIEGRLRSVKQLQGRIKQIEGRGGDAAALKAELGQVRADLAEPLALARAALRKWLPGELSVSPRKPGSREFVDANLAMGMLDFVFAREVKVKDFIMAAEFAHAVEGGRMVRMSAVNYAEFVERVDALRAKAPPERRAAVERATQLLLDAVDARPLPRRAPDAGDALMDARFEVRAPEAGDAITLAARGLASRNVSLASPLIRAGVGRDGHGAGSPLFYKDVAGLLEAAESGGVYKTSDAGIYAPLEAVALKKKSVSGLSAALREDGLIQVDIGTYDRGSFRFFVQPVRTTGYEGFSYKQ